MLTADRSFLAEPAVELVRRVQTGALRPVELVQASLDAIGRLDAELNAFQFVASAGALEAAQLLERRGDLSRLPMAGLPIAIKDNLHVAGMPTRYGSPAVPDRIAGQSHEIVQRAIAAGAIIVGKTRMPELGLWGTTDGAWGITRNPWNQARTPGGSSGGSAAAVAAGMVPLAVGNDGLGSLRIPAACCGLIGLKPGTGLVPCALGGNDWFGFTENGPLATTADDAALLLSVLAARPELREPLLDRPLRIALSTRSPQAGIGIDREHVAAAERIANLLETRGHQVAPAHPPYSVRIAASVLGHWFVATALDAAPLDRAQLESRTRTHMRWAPLAERLRLAGPAWRTSWQNSVRGLFDRFDVLLTPALAAPPIEAAAWSQRSWQANMVSNIRFAPFCAPWNLAGFAALTLPASTHGTGLPIGVQLVTRPGGERVLLGLARTLEQLQPWPRHAQSPA